MTMSLHLLLLQTTDFFNLYSWHFRPLNFQWNIICDIETLNWNQGNFHFLGNDGSSKRSIHSVISLLCSKIRSCMHIILQFSPLHMRNSHSVYRLALFLSIKDELPEYAKVCCLSHLVQLKINTIFDVLNRVRVTPHCNWHCMHE